MSVMDYLFAPRVDHRGWKTPGEASRILFLAVIAAVSIWAWPVSNGIVYMWALLVILISTPILSIGWWVLSIIGHRRQPRKLTPAVAVNPTENT